MARKSFWRPHSGPLDSKEAFTNVSLMLPYCTREEKSLSGGISTKNFDVQGNNNLDVVKKKSFKGKNMNKITKFVYSKTVY